MTILVAAVLAAASVSAAPDDQPTAFALAGPEGFGLSSSDGASKLYTHWLLQSDYRDFIGAGKPSPDRDTFLIRFAGLQLDAMVQRRFRAFLFTNFADNRVTLLETWIEAEILPWLRIRAGKFLYPISQERLTPGIALPFVNVSPSSLLLPSRDTGVQLRGTSGICTYNLALTNGAAAGSSGDSDADSGKDLVARAFVQPVRQIGLGIGASTGNHDGSAASPELLSLTTYGGQVWFSYAKAVATGRVDRLVPHSTFGWGPVAGYADAVFTREHVSGTLVTSRAWSTIWNVVLTGEEAAPLSFVTPLHPFDPGRGHFGTVELVAGAGDIRVGSGAFPALANPATAMQSMFVYGFGVDWFPQRGVALIVSYGHQIFSAWNGGPGRPVENTLIARLQLVL